MKNRELWQQIMHYGDFDRPYIPHWGGWPETITRWESEGMPKGADQIAFFKTPSLWVGIGADTGLYPLFPEEVIEETDAQVLKRDNDGTINKYLKNASSIPYHVDYTFKTADDWPEYKKRLQPHPGRLKGLAENVRYAETLDVPILVGTGSLMGWLRDWMGVENMSFLMYDDPDCFSEIVDTIADLVCWGIDQTIPLMTHSKPDIGMGWEDICGKSGPLVSTHLFQKHVAPGYRKIRDKLDSFGVHLLGIDSDGVVEPLTQHWLDAGVNVQFPIEYGTWQATPEYFRKEFGRELRIIGGFNKLVLEQNRAAIDAEIARHVDLLREGGFVMMPDHLITPDTPLANYQYYLEQANAIRLR